MKFLHLICKKADENSEWIGRQGVSLLEKSTHTYESGKWDFKLEDAKRLIGGDIYLHETKQEKSAFGGKVIDAYEVKADDVSRTSRIAFKFQFSPSHRGVAWKGASHGMAWTSGIIEED